MDTLRKQASRIREQVVKQQQAVMKQLTGSGYECSDVMVIDEVEMNRHQQLEKLYRCTRSVKDFQKDIVRAVEGLTAIGHKQIEIGTRLSDDCCRYGIENFNDSMLGKAASMYGEARKHVEKEEEDLVRLFTSQIMDPLKAMMTGAPLEDARNLAQRYSRMRQEAEAQASEISRRHSRLREAPNPENSMKLHAAESRMQELKENMSVLGKEAAAALTAVETHQEKLTFQRFVAMVEGERTYHERVATILGEVEMEIVSEKEQKESLPPVALPENLSEKTMYFLAEATHMFRADNDKELNLDVGDFVIVRKVSGSGWSEGECRGKGGWFPSAFVERRYGIPSS